VSVINVKITMIFNFLHCLWRSKWHRDISSCNL